MCSWFPFCVEVKKKDGRLITVYTFRLFRAVAKKNNNSCVASTRWHAASQEEGHLKTDALSNQIVLVISLL